jgi:GNAT superfamily N-acetyltransferase
MQKHFRSSPKIKRLVIATCHRDVIDWLNPDYLYDTDLKSWDDLRKRGCLRRPRISLRIRSEEDGENLWSIFKRHHYLSSSYNKSANAFAAEIDGQIVGMSSILRFPNGNFKNGWREHRTVILPEFQGLGIGTALSETIADMVLSSGGRFFSKTSHPAFGAHRDKSMKWRGTSKNHQSRGDYNKNRKTKEDGHKMLHANRVCYSHEYIGNLENN